MWWNRPTFQPPALPEPDGYDKIQVATEMLHPRTGFYGEMNPEELTEVVEHNEPALRLARMGLAEECVVTLEWGGDRTWLDTVHMQRIGNHRNLARAFTAEAFHEVRLGNVGNAIKCGFDSIRSGVAVAEGGLIIDWQVGHANVYQGLATIRSLVRAMSKTQASELIEDFEHTPFVFEDPNSLLRRELEFFKQLHGPVEWWMIGRVAQSQQRTWRLSLPNTEKRYHVQKELLITHLALRCYELDHGHFPKGLGELVPDYLADIPSDSFSGDALRYRREEDGYLLYSVGLDGVDDGGVEPTSGSDKGDLLLDDLLP